MLLVHQRRKWYLDGGCTRHINTKKSKFSFLIGKGPGHVAYKDNDKGKIVVERDISTHF